MRRCACEVCMWGGVHVGRCACEEVCNWGGVHVRRCTCGEVYM